MTIDEVWKHFLGNKAPYHIDIPLIETKHEFTRQDPWGKPTEAQFNGLPIIAQRRIATRSKLPAVFSATFADYIYNERTSSLLVKTDERIVI